MRNFDKVILRTFVVAFGWTANTACPTGGQLQELNKAIRCVHNITDVYLMTQYDSHTNNTVGYLKEYLPLFNETNDVFLRHRADKNAKKAAAEAPQKSLKEQIQASVKELTASEQRKLRL